MLQLQMPLRLLASAAGPGHMPLGIDPGCGLAAPRAVAFSSRNLRSGRGRSNGYRAGPVVGVAHAGAGGGAAAHQRAVRLRVRLLLAPLALADLHRWYMHESSIERLRLEPVPG